MHRDRRFFLNPVFKFGLQDAVLILLPLCQHD